MRVGIWPVNVMGDADEYLLLIRFLHFSVFFFRLALPMVRKGREFADERGRTGMNVFAIAAETFCSSILRMLEDRCSRHFLACKQHRHGFVHSNQASVRVCVTSRARLFCTRWSIPVLICSDGA